MTTKDPQRSDAEYKGARRMRITIDMYIPDGS